MDDQSKKTLDEILAKEPAALTDADKEFLRARRSYLNEEQRVVYAEALGEQSVQDLAEPEPNEGEQSSSEENPTDGESEEQPARRGRKPKAE